MKSTTLPKTDDVSVSRLWVGAGCATYVGRALDLASHSTAVHCVVVGLDEPFRLRISPSEEISARSVLVPPRRVHQVLAGHGAMMFCYLDVTASRSRLLSALMEREVDGFGVGHVQQQRLIELARSADVDPHALVRLAGQRSTELPDARVTSVLEHLRRHAGTSISAETTAQVAHLSTSHFLHLFASSTGTSFRRYKLWLRMLRTADAIVRGETLTAAAVGAGFASASHFSDAFVALFGLSPTSLIGSGTEVHLLDVPT